MVVWDVVDETGPWTSANLMTVCTSLFGSSLMFVYVFSDISPIGSVPDRISPELSVAFI